MSAVEIDYAITKDSIRRQPFRSLRAIVRHLANIALTLFSISYLTSWGLILAERGRGHLPAQPLQAAWVALVRVGQYFLNHPGFYYWHKETTPAFWVIIETLQLSAGLLLLALGVAMLIGFALGVIAAVARRKTLSTFIVIISMLGVSTPSFLFAMFLWVINIWTHRVFDIKVLPSAGFGWDWHLVMPVLVLAMRPLAQIAQVTYVSMRDILRQDYIRTAQSKGLSRFAILSVHILPNVLIPILITLGSSLRFSLASLPVVELFFEWPGIGLALLNGISLGNDALVIDLILSLGLFFLLVNFLIEFSFPVIDARLRVVDELHGWRQHLSFVELIQEAWNTLLAWMRDMRRRFDPRTEGLPPLPINLIASLGNREPPALTQRRWILKNVLANPALIVGAVSLAVILGIVLFGEKLTNANPYEIHGVMMIDGKIGAPPYRPSHVFPWGTDHIGRDIQALVLAGGRQTLSLVFFGMLARLLLGSFLGSLAGWQKYGWFDRLVAGAVGVWAAFPVTLFSMILIQALGIQQGMWVFIVAISVSGWGEVAQFVRGQVIGLKPQLFIESARSIGMRADQIMVRHIIPNLVNSLVVLAALEMGGILMLLAELGFLNIFLGGGFRVMIGEAGRMAPIVASFSDVPEWSALIANIRQYWRSYPWMALYPGVAVFLTIISFNMFGEGLRRFLDDSHANLSRLFNRYTFMTSVLAVVIVTLVVQSSDPINMYYDEGLKFNQQRAMQDIEALSSDEMQGRETGMPGAERASDYIASQMAQIGIVPAGEHGTYFQRVIQPRAHLLEMPQLAILDGAGLPLRQLVYKQDFTEIARYGGSRGDAQAKIVGVAYGPTLDPKLNDEFGLGNSKAVDRIVVVRAEDLYKVNTRWVKGALVIADETYPLQRRDLYPYLLMRYEYFRPLMLISPEVADALLKTAGSSLAMLDAARASLEPGKMQLTNDGTQVSMSLRPQVAENNLEEAYINVIGVIPGQGHFVDLEDKVIIVSAYYDGLGVDPAGTIYPGANDNASGVAMMLELARLMKESAYQPDKTVLFVAWAGGERQEGLSVFNIMNARPGGSSLTVETVVELSGVGYGTDDTISLGDDSSYRLVRLFQNVASRYNISTTTRGRSPHYGIPAQPAFGGRDAMTLSISWGGSDYLAHTPADVFDIIDPDRLYDIGRATYVTLLALSRETKY